MVIIKREMIKQIPCLFITGQEQVQKALPVIIYLHGFNGEKDASLTTAFRLAEKGFRVILFDSIYHGERQATLSQAEKELHLFKIVMQNIQDVATIKDYLLEHQLLLDNRIGIGGVSMGGISTYGALVKYDWIKTIAVTMGTPKVTEFTNQLIAEVSKLNPDKISEKDKEMTLQVVNEIDLSLHPEAMKGVPVFAWHGELDNLIPVTHSVQFFKEHGNALTHFIAEPGRMHNPSRLSIDETVKWFMKNL